MKIMKFEMAESVRGGFQPGDKIVLQEGPNSAGVPTLCWDGEVETVAGYYPRLVLVISDKYGCHGSPSYFHLPQGTDWLKKGDVVLFTTDGAISTAGK